MRMDHAALYVRDLEAAKAFYERYFGACAGAKYQNPRTGLSTYFLSFDGEGRVEIMQRPGLAPRPERQAAEGYVHIAFSLGSRAAVDALTERLRADGHAVISGPRTTGDGYYESCVLDPEGNPIELVG